MGCNVTHVDGWFVDRDRGRVTVEDLIVPLIEDGDPPIAARNARKGERAVVVTLGERKIRAIGTAETDIALCKAERVVSAGAEEAFVRGAAHVRRRDLTRQGVVTRPRTRSARENRGLAGVDDGRIGKPDHDMKSRRSILLEVAGLAHLDER